MISFVIEFTKKDGNKGIKSIGAYNREDAEKKIKNLFPDIQTIDSIDEE